MTVLFGLDSVSEVSPQAHHAVGSSVALRYLSRTTSKAVSRGEFDDYQKPDHGIGLFVVFEDGAQNALGSYADGKSDGEYGLRQALAAGMPADGCAAYAADYDPSGREHASDDYYDGVGAVWTRQRCGPYGAYSLVARAATRGFHHLWGTYAWSNGQEWHGDRGLPGVRAQQYSNDHFVGGVGVDFDHLYPDGTGYYGQWGARQPAGTDVMDIFPVGPYPWKGRLLRERDTFREYRRLRNRSRVEIFAHRRRLGELRFLLGECRDRIYWRAHYDGKPEFAHLPPRWGTWHLGERFQYALRCADGGRF